MPIEHELRDGNLVWIRNPVTGVISYVVDLRAKSFAFTLGARPGGGAAPTAPEHLLDAEDIESAKAACPFCPGNEERAPSELFRISPEEMPAWNGSGFGHKSPWVIRVFNNLFPRIPDELTGGRNESYVVVEDPRHFIERPRTLADLMFTGALGEEHFLQIMLADAQVMRLALENPAVRSVAVRKNQGRESGASQPHVHQQIIGSPVAMPAAQAEALAERASPQMWRELIDLMERLGLAIEKSDGVVSYASPIGTFPRSYDVVMPEFRGLLHDLTPEQLRPFAGALYRLIRILGPLPFDYEIHQGEDLPLHAHLNARLYPYSNVAGTLNIPATLLETAAAIRRSLARH